ncbi:MULTISPECIES: restriction endonuclease [Candidatus Cryosericum]|jgi:restriction system protein|uniref:Restriction endonuclease n=2 Tax=Candidatus Cryosericum TaxID=2498709 RepID=A0A398DGF4_9BACT|nr:MULTISPECIES: restriction endonuclease [Cryosericum]RIE07096.1 restriction endonuclease [Candidatus Cryosericum odellii]RIE10697.1 restriction endonuclease [Candidatus Cryosericum hinesii]RIE12789.1 restriction endonuclease [Candidatus Cryosericum hinesii]RIE12843.1 restriction endonuclease [Candidatus Cryosericum hinesii]
MANKYYVDVKHDGLNRYKRITGDDAQMVQTKGEALLAQWNEVWKRNLLKTSVERKKEEAEFRREEAAKVLQELNTILSSGLEKPIIVDWESLKQRGTFNRAVPTAASELAIPSAPDRKDPAYTATMGILDLFSAARRASRTEEAAARFEEDTRKWKEKKAGIEVQNAKAAKEHTDKVTQWHDERASFLKKQDEQHQTIDAQRQSYLAIDADAVVDYCDLVLSESSYPDWFTTHYDINYAPATKILVVDYSLPAVEDLPTLKEVKYVVARDEFAETHLTPAKRDALYDQVLYMIILRTLHELYEADVADAIDSIVLNGWVRSIDRSTGHEVNACIMSVQTVKKEFMEIDLAKVEPKACFKKLKGVGSAKLSGLSPIKPILQLNKEDKRFIEARDVEDGLDSSTNLAAMDWEDFEHLIRQLFEEEFAVDGGEVKVTRASRDGGVDAVAFDPDPLRGGKIVIQAKRYTNTVGVSAVRDLYGTLINEGASRGILVTTADYGPDAYSFAKDKPLTLLSGSNLLNLLGKHGHKARIDLAEARTEAEQSKNR